MTESPPGWNTQPISSFGLSSGQRCHRCKGVA